MESAEQKKFVEWFRDSYPEYVMSLRVSLRGLNFGSGARAARLVNFIKSQGSVDGEADIAVLVPRGGYGCLLVEHKADGSSHTLSDKQEAYLAYHNSIGNCATETRGLGELMVAVSEYMAGNTCASTS